MEKIKKYKEIIIIGVVILGLMFYWFQVRPTNIKKDCSWATEIIPADNGITKEQADENKIDFEKQCSTGRYTGTYNGLTGKQVVTSPKCWLLEQDSKERPSQPERKEVTEATDKEYETCLRQHGL